jgi:hypothetical protein
MERRFNQVVLVLPGWIVMLARRKAARSAASVCNFVARRRRCPGLMVAEMYVAMGDMPLVTKVAQVMCFGTRVLGGVTLEGSAGIVACDGATLGNGATLGSGRAVGAALGATLGSGGAVGVAVEFVEGVRGFEGVGATVGNVVAGVTLVRVRPQRAGKGTTLRTGAVGGTGGGITGVCDGCTVRSDAGIGGGSFPGMMYGRPVYWVKMLDS